MRTYTYQNLGVGPALAQHKLAVISNSFVCPHEYPPKPMSQKGKKKKGECTLSK